ncbi:MAG: response regulator [Myxococcota bacterium]
MRRGRATILVVDDESAVVQALAEALTSEGYVVVAAPHGLAALEAVTVHRPDLILLDLMMPVMDGLAFLRRLRAQSPGDEVPVVLMTAATSALLQAPERSWDHHLPKPFTFPQLEQVVQRVLARRRQPA